MNRVVSLMLCGLLSAVLSSQALSAPITIDFTQSSARNASVAQGLNYRYLHEDTNYNLNVRGLWGYNDNSINGANVQTWRTHGLGVYDGPDPHTIGNHSDQYEMVLLDFGQSVALNSFTVAGSKWGSDNWASVLAFTGSGSGGADSVIGNAWSDLVKSGFSVAGEGPNSFTGVSEGVSKAVTGGLVSQYWLLGVYNAAFAESLGVDPLKTYTESFKLANLSFSVPEISEVPLPAAAWLFLTGLAGMTWLKKRKAKRELAFQRA